MADVATCTKTRRGYPTFLLPADPPTWGVARAGQSFRERVKGWNLQVVGEMNAYPYVAYVFLLVKLVIHAWLFLRFVRVDTPLTGEDNVKRFLLYNIIGDVLGFNATSGPLGFRMTFSFCTWYNMVTPGTITVPLLPGVEAKRKLWQVVLFILYIACLLYPLLSAAPIGLVSTAAPLAVLAIMLPFDLVVFQASRGEHYIYVLVCMCAPWNSGGLLGARLCQAALWFWAGVAKMGPWMKYVNAFMMPNSKVMFLLNVLGVPVTKLLYKDHPNDVNPSRFLSRMADFACWSEILLGPLCLFFPVAGVVIASCFHLYILSMTPFASVMEWNYLCLYMIQALFVFGDGTTPYTGYSPGSLWGAICSAPLWLRFFWAVCLLAVPLYGNFNPKKIPFLVRMGPYAGNWRFTWHVVAQKAKHKLRRLKTLESVFFEENAKLLWGKSKMLSQGEDFFTGNMVFFPHFRPIVPIIEQLQRTQKWGVDDFITLFNEPFLNAVAGWCLGTGWYVQSSWCDAIASTCDFRAGECFVVVFEPQALHDHTCEWHVCDVTNPAVKVIHGQMPYADLEKLQPTEMTLETLLKQSILKKAD